MLHNPATSAEEKPTRRAFVAAVAGAAVLGGSPAAEPAEPALKRKVYLVPNFHPASCGWLTTFSRERVYCANSYLNHLDRVRDDPRYEFVISEVNNIIAIMNFQPERIPELKERIRQKRVEAVNGYFLESAINLSGGEALARLGVEGLRWYRQVFDVAPRFSWNIDVCGTHGQIPQIAAELGFDALVYTRRNPTGKTLFWSVSPDGSRILTLCPGHYSELHPIFNTKLPLTDSQFAEIEKFIAAKEPITPQNAPLLVLAGADDYALAPLYKNYPSEFLEEWPRKQPGRELTFSTLSKYLDAVLPGIHSGEISIPTAEGGTAYDFDAFWIENPRVKTGYRRNEHLLQSAEALATVASLSGNFSYPVERLHQAWILMCLNMDRNTIWGSAGGMVFEDPASWDVEDRLTWIERNMRQVIAEAGASLGSKKGHNGLFNPLNWDRHDPVALHLPAGVSLAGIACEALPDGSTLCQPRLPGVAAHAVEFASVPPARPRPRQLTGTVETGAYLIGLDPQTGSLKSLRLKKSGRELLAGPANVIVAERPLLEAKHDDPGDHMPPRPERRRLGTSDQHPATITAYEGPVAITIEVQGKFFDDGSMRRTMRFYHDHPRIDFETELNDVPNFTVVVSEFPLAEDILEVRRGIPFGFSHGAWAKPNPQLHGWTKGIVPAVRWTHYSLANGGGLSLLDRGLSGRELDARTPLLYLMNAEDKYWGYPNSWLSGRGNHLFHYALVVHAEDWAASCVPQLAWEYNSLPSLIQGRNSEPALKTSPNVVVEALRREGDHVEIRLVECYGSPGTATVEFRLPHRRAAITDFAGRVKTVLPLASQYSFPVRPQQIVTLQFQTTATLSAPEPIKAWDPFVPAAKLAALHRYDPSLIGHPPFGTENPPPA